MEEPLLPVHIPFNELLLYGNHFQEKLGQGSFGEVFKGKIPKGERKGITQQEIAIKVNRGKTIKRTEFKMETSILASINHPNIIKLVGYSNDTSDLCLVYEYMRKGSLRNNIHELDWPTTLKIIRDMANVINHLHQQEPQIIFRDLKSENILIDEDFNAKLSDFGLAKRGDEGLQSGGTYGSSDILAIKGPASPESDIFSIGILILELLTKQSQYVNRGLLPKWIRGRCMDTKGKMKNIKKVVHKSLRASGCDSENGRKAIQLGLDCTHDKTSQRPTIGNVCKQLENLKVEERTCFCC